MDSPLTFNRRSALMSCMISHSTLDEMLALSSPSEDGTPPLISEESVRSELVSRYHLPYDTLFDICVKYSATHTPSKASLRFIEPSVVFQEALQCGDTHLAIYIMREHPETVSQMSYHILTKAPFEVVDEAMKINPDVYKNVDHLGPHYDSTDDVIRLFHRQIRPLNCIKSNTGNASTPHGYITYAPGAGLLMVSSPSNLAQTTTMAAGYISYGKYNLVMELYPEFWDHVKETGNMDIIGCCIRSGDVEIVKKAMSVLQLDVIQADQYCSDIYSSCSVDILDFFYPKGDAQIPCLRSQVSLPKGEKAMAFFKEVASRASDELLSSTELALSLTDGDHLEGLMWLNDNGHLDADSYHNVVMSTMYHAAEKCFHYLWSKISDDVKDGIIMGMGREYECGSVFTPNISIFKALCEHSTDVRETLILICISESSLEILKWLDPTADEITDQCFEAINFYSFQDIHILKYLYGIKPPTPEVAEEIVECNTLPIIKDILNGSW
jgi:hypothetical protein